MRICVDLIAWAPGEPGMQQDAITDSLDQLATASLWMDEDASLTNFFSNLSEPSQRASDIELVWVGN